jgi:hypothetical protein
MDVAAARVPASGSTYYLAHDRGGHLDHHVLYHGLDWRANERLAGADVLFVGNSRLMLALDRQVLRTVFARSGLRYYVLGFGHDEGHGFPLAVIERRQLAPDVVVVNADGFFSRPYSPWAREVLDDSQFDAVKHRFEAAAAHAVRRRLHALLPHWPDVVRGRREWVIYRSALDGTWDLGTHFDARGPLPLASEGDEATLAPEVVSAARTFKAAVERRGASLVLALVPSPDHSRARAEALAETLGVPVVAPAIEAPRTMDGSHLAPESAEAFGRVFLTDLADLLTGAGR